MRKKSNRAVQDDLRPEYDFRSLRVVARGPGRKTPKSPAVQLAPDVAKLFPDSQSVNEALRFLVRLARSQMEGSR
ncbi:MAG: hypothetical protein A3J28_12550 [Acidobacteria bacterium RIFCSPLOWO2_12_FULL_60_22]|nr:MAG: hypothetical protein A3J28_12550 [Acidobacteria bacterium RIFCSPLOWO2_12_FULL_60_22]